MALLKYQTLQALVKAGRQALFIGVAAAAMGLGVNALRPQGIDLIRSPGAAVSVADSMNPDGPQTIELTAALEIFENENAIFIDARSEYDYDAGHIQTARNYPEKTLDIWMPEFFDKTPPETLLIVYCSDPRCHLAERLAVRLYDLGYTNVRILTAGWSAWQASGYPVELGPAFTNGQSLDQTTGCSTGECGDELTSPAETGQRDWP